MSAKRFVLACSAVGALLTTVTAQSPTPEPLPAPRPVPIAPPDAPIVDKRAALSRFLEGTEDREMERMCRSAPADVRQVVARAICIRVPHGWAESLGRVLNDRPEAADGKPNLRVWILTPREARLLAAVVAAGPTVDVLNRPQLTLTDDQTGFFQVSSQTPLVTGLRVESKNGADVYTAQVTTADVGMTLRLTPKIKADGRSVLLQFEADHQEVGGPAIPVVPASFVTDQGVVHNRSAPVSQVGVTVNSQSVRATVELPDGGTLIVCCSEAEGRGAGRVVWLLTPHVVGGQPAPTPIPTSK